MNIRRLFLKFSNKVWIEKSGKKYNKMSDIDDASLKRIISEDLYNWKNIDEDFLTKDRLNKLFSEAYSRKLYRQDSTLLFNRYASCNAGYERNYPKYTINAFGDYATSNKYDSYYDFKQNKFIESNLYKLTEPQFWQICTDLSIGIGDRLFWTESRIEEFYMFARYYYNSMTNNDKVIQVMYLNENALSSFGFKSLHDVD